ncbi:MAG: methyltransferase domain-containing protein [Candidatus Marinimicrobia bacterium]|nr:methyltransferase domain-containing protein [Candidatus Neomarinimicrobiota bacterium]
MSTRWGECKIFFREFRDKFEATGSVTPSSRYLARALTQPLRGRAPGPARILEVGPGTGSVTAEIVRQLRADDCFHLIELNARFVELLERRFAAEPLFQRAAGQMRLFHGAVESFAAEAPYDHIICGLPFNNFPAELAAQILGCLFGLLTPGGSMTFFEYPCLRPFKMCFSSAAQRRRARETAAVLDEYMARYQRGRRRVFRNVPPATAHYLYLT